MLNQGLKQGLRYGGIAVVAVVLFSVLRVSALWGGRVPTVSSSCNVSRQVLKTVDPIDHTAGEVSFYRYVPKTLGAHVGVGPYFGTIVIHPPTGGITGLDRGYAEGFCKGGISVALLETWTGYAEEGAFDFGTHDRASARAITATEAVIDHLGTPVALLGESVGAIYSSMVMGLDKRVKAAALIVGGGPLIDVLTETDQAIPAGMRLKRLTEYHLNPEQYRARLLENVKMSPTDHADKARQRDLFMVIGTRDTTVPTRTQWELWELWGQPTYHSFPLNHVQTIVAAYLFYRGNITSFLLSKLETESL